MSGPAVRLSPPPPRSDPRAYYLEYLPALWRAAAGEAILPEVELEVELRIGGRGGEQRFTLGCSGGVLVTHEGPANDPIASCACDREAWHVAAFDVWPRLMKRLPPITPRARARALAAVHAHARQLIAAVRELPGRVSIEFTDDAGDLSRYQIIIGSGAGPAASVALSDADLWHLAEVGGGASLAKLLRTRMRLLGETGYVLRLVNLLEPRG